MPKSIGRPLTCRLPHLAAVGGVFEFARSAAANLREKNDHYNASIGGFFAGSILGVRGRFMPWPPGGGAGGIG